MQAHGRFGSNPGGGRVPVCLHQTPGRCIKLFATPAMRLDPQMLLFASEELSSFTRQVHFDARRAPSLVIRRRVSQTTTHPRWTCLVKLESSSEAKRSI